MESSITKILLASLFVMGVVITSCQVKKDTPPTTAETPGTYTSLADFYAAKTVKSEFFNIDAAKGGSFVSAKGTKVTIKPNSFVDASNNLISGTVKIEFKDIYKKSDMLLSQKAVMLGNGAPLKSAGEFFIKATQDSNALSLAAKQSITVEQPANGAVDKDMKPFIFRQNVAGKANWSLATDSFSGFDSVLYLTNSYLFQLYKFSNPVTAGSWCNSDNSTYFSAYTTTSLTMIPDFPDSVYHTDVYLIFKGINCMVHVYREVAQYPYLYAPTGLACTIVTVGYKDNKLYSSFIDNTITTNQTVHIPALTETTDIDFVNKLKALDQ